MNSFFAQLVFKHIALYLGLPKEIYFLSLARLITSFGDFVLPFLTLVLTDKLGFSARQAGDIMLYATAMYIPGSLIGGKWCDLIGRKKIFLLCQFFFAFCYILCGIFGVSPYTAYCLVAARFFIGAGNPAQQAMMMDMTRPSNRQAAFSLIYLTHNLGSAAGIVLAGFLYNRFMRLLFWGDALTTILSILVIAFFIKETMPASQERDESGLVEERAESKSLIPVLLGRPLLVAFVGLCFLMNMIYAQHFFSLPIQMKVLFGEDGPRYFGFLMALNALLVIVMTAFIIAFLKRLHPLINLGLTAMLYALGFGMLAFSEALGLFFISTCIWTIGEIIAETNENVYLADHTPKSHRGRFNALLQIIIGLGFALSPYLTGKWIDRFSVSAVWPLTFVISLAVCGGFFILFSIEKKRTINSEDPIC